MAVSKKDLKKLREVIKEPDRFGMQLSDGEQNALKCYNIDSDHYLGLFFKERTSMANAILGRAKQTA